MRNIRKGDIVGRKSYGKDIYFKVVNIIEIKNEKVAILNGLFERIEADSLVSDLEIIPKNMVSERLEKTSKIIDKKIKINKYNYKRSYEKTVTGKILHLDGDRKYSEKSYNYYKKVGLNATVKNIPEYKQRRNA